ncbi:MAG: hypothetical protein AAFQ98_18660, partial [Bacteroidota bacterium]
MKHFWIGVLGLAILACQPKESPQRKPQEEPFLMVVYDTATLIGPGVISSELPEFATTVSADGKEMFFNRTTEDRSSMRIFRSEWAENAWSEPTPLPFSQGTYRDVDPFLSHDGRRLYFSSNRPSARGESDFNHWYAERTEGGWAEPILLDAPLNSDSAEIYITQTQSGTAYFRTARWGSRDLAR